MDEIDLNYAFYLIQYISNMTSACIQYKTLRFFTFLCRHRVFEIWWAFCPDSTRQPGLAIHQMFHSHPELVLAILDVSPLDLCLLVNLTSPLKE